MKKNTFSQKVNHFFFACLLLVAGNSSAQNTLDLIGLSSGAPAKVAYSVRRLSTSYTGNLIQVRRSSDNTTQDIGYDGNGNLDQSALTTFVGSNDGFISKWYDQSGNGNDAVQATTGSQPQIVSSGTVLTSGSRPVIKFNGSTFIDGGTSSYSITGAHSLSAVYNFQSGTVQHIIDRAVSGNPLTSITGSNQGQYRNDAGSLLTVGSTQSPPFSNTFTATWDASNNINHYKNGVSDYSGSLSLPATLDLMRIGKHFSITGTAVLNFWEVILFPSSISSGERTAMECNQLSYYNMFSVSAGSNVTICNGASTTLTATGASTYTWAPSVSLSASTGASVTAMPTATTTYTVTGTSTVGCSSTSTVTVTANALPATIKATGADIITTVAGNGSSGFSGDGAAATAAQINVPIGTATDASGNLYIADLTNNRIRKVTPAGVITTFAGTGTAGYSGDGGAATAANISAPYGVATDASGNVYIADKDNNRIRMVNTSGIISTFAGSGTNGFSGDGGAATAANLNLPTGVGVDASGNVYIADGSNNRVRKVTTGGIITTFAGTGTGSFAGDGGAATAANLWNPAGIVIDASNNVYIADLSNDRVRKVSASGIITTFAGTGTIGYNGDGIAAASANIWNPFGIAIDASGEVYFSDLGHYRIRKVNAAGVIATVAGTGSSGYSGDGGAATSAQMNYPYGVAIDAAGNIYFADPNNARIRKVSGGTRTVCAGSSITLTNATSGGTWSSGNGNVSLSGTATTSVTVTGVSAGTSNITYTLSTGCYQALTVTVNALPTVAAITGNTTLSTTISTTLASTTPGGVWTSAATGTATIGSSTGIVTGVSAGTALISYTVTTSGCSTAVTTNVTVNTPENGLHFDGTNDYVAVSGNTGIPSGNSQYTIEAWIKPTAGGIYGIAGWGNYGANNEVTAFRLTNATTLHHYWWFNDLPATVPNLVDGNWHHVVATYNGTTRALYCDGNLVASDVPSGHNVTVTNNLTIGRTYTAEYFPGSIDEVRIWNVGRTQAQIQANMNCDVSQQAGLVAYYRFNQGTAAGTNTGLTCAFDYSGNANSGTLTNFNLSGGTSNYVTGAVGNCNTATPIAPGSFSGNTPVCIGSTITLGNANTGGVWSTASGNITLNSTSGLVTGVTAGTAVVNYTLNCSSSSVTVTINALPTVAAITGTTTLNLYNTTTLSDATPSGVWSSTATGVATVGTSGVVTGVAEGTSTISYTVTDGAGCTAAATTNVTVSGYNAIQFDGSNDYMITPDLNSGLSGTSVTVELWFRASAAGVIVNELGSPGVGSGWHDTWMEVLPSGEVKVRVWSLSSVSLGFITFGSTWHHVALRHNATTNKLDGMLDGVVSSGSSSGGRSTSGAVFLAFGIADGQNLGSGAYLNGAIDEVRIWNRALCDGEIINNMSGRLNGAQTGLAAYYTLDQGIAGGTNTGLTTAIDYSGNGRNATLVNSALTGTASNWVTGTVTTSASVYSAPSVSAGSNVTICNGSSTTLTASGGTSYRWSPATALSATTGSSVTANPSSTITYTVTDVCGGTATVQVSVNATTPAITSVTPLLGYPGSAVTIVGTNFDATTTNNIVYFGATQATVTAATTTTLNVTVPTGATFAPITVKTSTCGFQASSQYPYLPSYNNITYVASTENLALPATLTASTNPHSVAIGDIDGDGKPDLVTTNSNSGVNSVSVYWNQSTSGTLTSGSFAAKVDFATGTNPAGVRLHDVDGDGKLDMIVANAISNTVSVFRNTSTSGSITTGSFAAKVDFTTGASSTPVRVAVGDIDGDGRPDIATSNIGNNRVAVLRNTSTAGSISFATNVNLTPNGLNPFGLAMADLDGDGKLDLACTNSVGTTGISVFRNTSTSGTVSFAASVNTSSADAWDLTNGDIDGDGKQDLVAIFNTPNQLGVFRNGSTPGTISFSSAITFATPSSPQRVTLGDIDGDSKPDMLVVNTTGNNVSVFRNTATSGSITTGSFSGRVDFAAANGPQGIATGDLDGDHKTDVVLAVTGGASLALYRNDPLQSIVGGNVHICVGGSTVTLTDPTPNGTWTSSNTAVATVGSSTGVVTGLTAGVVTITYAGTAGPTFNDNIVTTTVTVNALSTSASTAICNTFSTPLTASGGTAGTYTWSPATALSATTGTSVTASPTVTTTYTVTAVTPAGCTASAPITVTVNPLPTVFSVTGGGPYCAGTGGSVVDLSGSQSGVNYQLFKGGSTPIGSPVAGSGSTITFGQQPLTGTYTAVATNATTGCASNMSSSVFVSILPAPAAVNVMGGGAVCGGGPGVSVYLAGSAVGIDYQLYHNGSPVGSPMVGVGTALNFGLFTTLGTYTATATNPINGCSNTMTGSAIITAASGITTYTVTGTGSYCSGGSGVAVGLSGSTSGISYQLFLGSTAIGSAVIGTGSAISFGLQTFAGTYTVVGTNTSTGCFGTMTGSAVISIDPLPNIHTVTGGGAYCAGGSGVPVGLSLSQTGVDYQLYVGVTPTGSPVAGTGSAISFGSQTAAGTYTIEAINTTTTCTNTMGGSVTVSINPLPTVSGGSDVTICAAMPTVLTGTGAIDYSWSPATALSATTGSSVTASPTTTITYTVTGTDGNGCVNTAPVTVSVNPLPTVSGGSSVAICNGSSTGLTASGALTYSWSPATALSATTGASVTANPTSTTTYTVTGTDANSCMNSAAVTVTVNPIPTVSGGSNVGVCTGSNTTLTASGATDYTWSPATALSATTGTSVTASPTVAVTYTVTGTSLGCSNTATVLVSVNPLPTYSAGADVAVCSGTPTVLSATEPGGAGNAIQFPGSGANYINIPSTASLKLMTSNFTVSTWIYVTSTSQQNILFHGLGCSTWASWFLGIGGAESNDFPGKIVFGYRTSNGGGMNQVPSPGTVTLNTWTQVTATYDGSNLKLYLDGSLVATVAASGTPWNSSDNLYIGQDPGCGGRNLYSGRFDDLQLWNVTRSASEIAGAYNQHVAAATSGIIGSWAFDEASGSAVSDSSSIADHGSIVGSLTRVIPSTAPILAPSSSSFTWSPAASLSAATGTPVSATPTVTTTYTVTGTNANGCVNTAMVTVTVNAIPTIGVSSGTTICSGQSTVLTGSGGTSYSWSPAAGLSSTVGTSVTASPTVTTTYTVTGTNASGCTNTATVMVSVNPLPSTAVGASVNPTCAGAASVLTASGAVTYSWSPATALSATTGTAVTATPTVTITYTVTGTSAAGCSSDASVTVTVNPLPTDYAITGGGSFCSSTSGTAIGLAGSDLGVNYQLYLASVAVGSPVAGTGAAISFGLHTASGVYTVVATNTTTGCTRNITGSTTLTSYTSPAPIPMTGGGAYCFGGTGVSVGLSGSAVGVNYQLYLGGSPVGSPVAGIGAGFSFGLQTAAGTYTAIATNTTSGCTTNMTGTAVVSVHAALTTHTVTGGGSFCSGSTGVAVGLNGSDVGVSYQLYRGGSPLVSTSIAGTGSAISYGAQTTAGIYTVVATNTSIGCTANMSGSATVVVNPVPTAYTISGGGSYCTGGSGFALSLSNSDIGIDYQLLRGGSPVGSPIAGTGTTLALGTHTTAGTYTVEATNTSTLCTSTMTGSTTILINPLPTVHAVSGGGSYCSGPGIHIYLNSSSGSTSYQLYNGASPVGSPLAGTGGILDFGAFTTPGTYTVVATNTITSCTNNMSGSGVIVGVSLPTVYAVTGGGSYCSGGTGVTVDLANSDLGINYQLYRGATAVGGPVAGTGAAISFGLQTTAGTYTVVATNATLGCTSTMSGSAVVAINPLPAAVSMTGGGSYCTGGSGVAVGLAGSAVGINYQLYLGATPIGSPLPGAGTSLNFGAQTTAGTYTAIATNTVTACVNNMSGTAVVSINPLPTVYTVTGGGSYCFGSVGVLVGLNGSQTGVNYQLFNGASPVGSPVAGTSLAITFGIQTAAGTYTVVATNATTGCISNMTGSATVTINPLPTVYTVTGGGAYCVGGSGSSVGLSNSDIGINYQLYNGSSPVGSPVAGTGSAISFGTFTLATTYTVIATDATTGCTRNMSGSATITINGLPAAVPVTGGGTICIGGTGVAVGLSASASGVSYQLYVGATPVGSPVIGVGGTLTFGLQTTIGTYTVIATNTAGCTNTMTGSAVINNYTPPTAFAVTGTGSYCSGGSGLAIGLAGSATGVTYQLFRGATAVGSPVSGTGSALSFGTHTTAGTYTVVGTTTSNGCTGNMTGSAVITINPLPNTHTVTGGGNYCAGGTGVTVSLGGSDIGTDYQLYNGVTAVGSPVSGTGSGISFGLQTAAGTYTVVATNTSTSCATTMTGSAVVVIDPLPTVYNVTGGGSYCSGPGVHVYLSNSTVGVNYQLFNGVTPVGSPVAGTGIALDFGGFTSLGTYTVVATNATTGCIENMSGSAVITGFALPTVYSVTGGGNYCSGGAGSVVGLSNSDGGVSYQLFIGASPTGSPVAGTGAPISFGPQTAAGTYTVVATNSGSSCVANMSGSATVTIDPPPAAHTVTGGGSYCTGGTGVAVGLGTSSTGVSYQLYNGVTAVGTPVSGTGSALSFGLQTSVGTYTVVATDGTSLCTATMTGSAVVTINSLPTTFTVTGGGNYCAGGAGVAVGMSGSQSGVNYQLFNGATAIGSPVAGTGAALTFGLQTSAGTYTVTATHATTTCTVNMTGSATVTIDPLPTDHAFTGGGTLCAGGTGATIGLAGSDAGVSYQLYRTTTAFGTVATGSPLAGTGSALSFGTFTADGTYTIGATNTTTGCSRTITGSAIIVVYTPPAAVTITGGGAYCAGGTGIAIGLPGSAVSVNYQLYLGATPVGAPVPGAGTSISFGLQTTPGTYTATGTSTVTGCTSNMTGSVTVSIHAALTTYSMTGGGSYCTGGTGVAIGLSGSTSGVSYKLYHNGSPLIGSVAGTGAAISFGTHTTAGTYTVIATNTATSCTANMSGTAVITINALPTAFTVTGGGSYCTGGTGVSVDLAGSASGINYQLYRGGTPVGSPVAGTGSAITFGLQTTAGTYIVVATNATTGCTNSMTGSATVSINALPAAFTVYGGGSYCAGGSTGPYIYLSGCTGLTTYQLYLGATPVGSPVSCTGGSMSFGTHTTVGTYTAVATSTLTGCTNNMAGSATVSTIALPTVYAVTGGGSYCTGGSGVSIGLASSNTGISYQLYRGSTPVGSAVSGTGSALSFGTHTTVGTYTVVATVTSSFCTSTMSGSAVVSIDPLPSVFSVTGGGSYCTGGTGVNVGLSSSTTGVNYQLYRSGTIAVGSPVAGTGTTLAFGLQTTAGTYTVVATNATTGCVQNMTGSATISINALPTVFTVTGGGSYCTGGSGVAVTLNGSQIGVTYQLFLGATPVGSPASGTGSTINFGLKTTAGTYTVVATNSSTSCTSNMTGSTTISINPLPTIFTVTGGGSYCAGGSGVAIGLSSSEPGVNYQLYRGGTTAVGSPVAGTGSAISFGSQTTAGTYTVKATNATTGCLSTMTGSATISINAAPTVCSMTGGGGYCSGGTGVNVGIGASISGVTYQLYVGATPVGSPVSGTGAGFNFGLQTAAGVYTAVATNTAGCSATMSGSATVTINSLPASFTVTGGGGFCTGTFGVAIGLSGSATGVTYKVYLSGTPVTTSISGTGGALNFGLFTTGGTYTVIATASGTGCTATMTGSATIVVHPVPTISGSFYTVAPGNTRTLTATPAGGVWSSGTPSVATVGSSSGIVTGVSLGSLYIYYTSAAGCLGYHAFWVTSSGFRQSPDDSTTTVQAVSGVSDVRLVPNPTRGTFTVKGHLVIAPGGSEDVTIDVTNMLGQTVYNGKFTAPGGELDGQVQLSNDLSNGMYIVTLHNGSERKVFHLVVEK